MGKAGGKSCKHGRMGAIREVARCFGLMEGTDRTNIGDACRRQGIITAESRVMKSTLSRDLFSISAQLAGNPYLLSWKDLRCRML